MSASSGQQQRPFANAPSPVRVWRRMLDIHADLIQDLEHEFVKHHGISASEFDVLVNIAPGTPIRHKELCDRVVLSRSALTRLVDRLVRRDLVSRESQGSDGRAVYISLTEAGQQLRQVALRTNSSVVRSYFAKATPQELSDLHGLLHVFGRPGPYDGGETGTNA